jgi:hypothetical protein
MKTVVQKTLPGDVPFPWSEKDPYRLPVSIDRVQKMLITLGVWRCVVCADVLGGGGVERRWCCCCCCCCCCWCCVCLVRFVCTVGSDMKHARSVQASRASMACSTRAPRTGWEKPWVEQIVDRIMKGSLKTTEERCQGVVRRAAWLLRGAPLVAPDMAGWQRRPRHGHGPAHEGCCACARPHRAASLDSSMRLSASPAAARLPPHTRTRAHARARAHTPD